MIRLKFYFCLVLCLAAGGCGTSSSIVSQTFKPANAREQARQQQQQDAVAQEPQRRSSGSAFLDKLSDAAIDRTKERVRYDPTYYVLDYPNGDPPPEVGVCTDEVIRSYRKLDIDLQREVHEDMKSNFSLYPKKWGLSKPDTNIDHRRVPNLMVFFERKGASLPVTSEAKDYAPGDVVTWDLGGGLTHIGLVVGIVSSADPQRLLIVHDIGAGPQLEDVLFNWKITGHYRYTGEKK